MSLGGLLEYVGPTLLTAASAPRGLDVRVRATVIHDPADRLPPGEGDDAILLMIGSNADDEELGEVVRAAAENGYAAVAVKPRGRPTDGLVVSAAEAGLAVLTVTDEVHWRDLDALMMSGLGANGVGVEVSGVADPLFALANSIAVVFGGSVAIENLEQNVLAYSSVEGQLIDPLRTRGILERKVPATPYNADQYRRVLNEHDICRFPELDGELPRAAIAIRAGTVPLGTIWAIESDGRAVGTLTREKTQALIDGAEIAALHMLRERDAAEVDSRRRGEVLRTLLTGVRPSGSEERVLGLGAGVRFTLTAFAPSYESASAGTVNRIHRVASRHYGTQRPSSSVTQTQDAVYVLLPHEDIETATGIARRLVSALGKELDVPAHAAVSAERTQLGDLLDLRSEADEVIRCRREFGGTPDVATVDDLRCHIMLCHVFDDLERNPRLRDPRLQELLDRDAEHGTEYARTLRTWLEEHGNVQRTAERLNLHGNTVRYRLERAVKLSGVRLEDPDARLGLWLQLRATS